MALWDLTEPPPEAAAFLEMMKRLSTRAWDETEATIRRMSDGTSVRSILLRQAKAMGPFEPASASTGRRYCCRTSLVAT